MGKFHRNDRSRHPHKINKFTLHTLQMSPLIGCHPRDRACGLAIHQPPMLFIGIATSNRLKNAPKCFGPSDSGVKTLLSKNHPSIRAEATLPSSERLLQMSHRRRFGAHSRPLPHRQRRSCLVNPLRWAMQGPCSQANLHNGTTKVKSTSKSLHQQHGPLPPKLANPKSLLRSYKRDEILRLYMWFLLRHVFRNFA